MFEMCFARQRVFSKEEQRPAPKRRALSQNPETVERRERAALKAMLETVFPGTHRNEAFIALFEKLPTNALVTYFLKLLADMREGEPQLKAAKALQRALANNFSAVIDDKLRLELTEILQQYADCGRDKLQDTLDGLNLDHLGDLLGYPVNVFVNCAERVRLLQLERFGALFKEEASPWIVQGKHQALVNVLSLLEEFVNVCRVDGKANNTCVLLIQADNGPINGLNSPTMQNIVLKDAATGKVLPLVLGHGTRDNPGSEGAGWCLEMICKIEEVRKQMASTVLTLANGETRFVIPYTCDGKQLASLQNRGGATSSNYPSLVRPLLSKEEIRKVRKKRKQKQKRGAHRSPKNALAGVPPVRDDPERVQKMAEDAQRATDGLYSTWGKRPGDELTDAQAAALARVRAQHCSYEGTPLTDALMYYDSMHLLINAVSHWLKDLVAFVYNNAGDDGATVLADCKTRLEQSGLSPTLLSHIIPFVNGAIERLKAKTDKRSIKDKKGKTTKTGAKQTQQDRRLQGDVAVQVLENTGRIMDCFNFESDNNRVRIQLLTFHIQASLLGELRALWSVHDYQFTDEAAADKYFGDFELLCNAYMVLMLLFDRDHNAMRPTSIWISEMAMLAKEWYELTGLGMGPVQCQAVEHQHQLSRAALKHHSDRKDGDCLQALRWMVVKVLKQFPWPTREHRTYTPRAPKHRVIKDKHVVPSFLGEHSEVGPKSWEEEMVEKIFECVRERRLTEEMHDLVFGTSARTLVVGVVKGDMEEPKRKSRNKAPTTGTNASATTTDAGRRKKRGSGNQ